MDAPLIFVNSLEVHGTLNGVVNMLLSTARFLPDGEKVTAKSEHAVDLRFDLFLAQQIHDALGKILAEQTKPTAKPN